MMNRLTRYVAHKGAPSLFLLLIFGCGIAAEHTMGDGALTIVEPSDNATVVPGQSVNFKVEVTPDVLPGFILIMSDRRSYYVPFTGRLDGPPFEGPVQISPTASGPVEVSVFLMRSGEGPMAGDKITLNVQSAERPLRIETQTSLHLGIGKDDPGGLRSRLRVTGYFNNGVRRDISGAPFGTTYTSLTPEVISVASNGQLTPLRPGFGFVAVDNAGHHHYSRVVVRDEQGAWPPPEDKTLNVAIQASGFRRDPQTGFFVQQLTLRNTSNVPLPKAIHVLIDELPEGVELKDTMGSPKAPLTGKLALVKVEGENFLGPGETATATLKFSNREGVPITYSKRVFCGGTP